MNKIVIFTLDSLYSTLSFNILHNHLKNRIVAVVLSDRYGGNRGSFIKQVLKLYKKSGFHFLQYMSFLLIYYKFFLLFQNKINFQFIRKICKNNNIKIFKTNNINGKKSEEFLNNIKPELIVSTYFDQVLGKSILNIPTEGCINLHPGILPDFKGPFPLFWTIHEDSNQFGFTIHKMNEKLDEGDILVKELVNKKEEDSLTMIKLKVFKKGSEKLLNVIDNFKEYLKNSVQQYKKCCYYSYPNKNNVKNLYKKNKLYRIKDYFLTDDNL